MGKTLHQLACRNIKKYKQQYLLISILIFLMAIVVMTCAICQDNYYEVMKAYNQEIYGKWYYCAELSNHEDLEAIEEYISLYTHPPVRYGYGFYYWDDEISLNIGCMSDEVYDLCRLDLVEGRYPQNDQEIMINEELLNYYHLHDQITIHINQKEISSLKIVGIIHRSQEQFPDVYINSPIEGMECRLYADRDLSLKEHTNFHVFEKYNPYGYSEGVEGMYQYSLEQMLLFIEAIGLSAFALILFTSTSLKRRSHEFALLRGIGMTTKQMLMMVGYEMFYTSLMATLCGSLLSLGVSYGIMKYIATQIGYFICEYSFLKMGLYAFLFIICVVVTSLYPIYTSSHNALSGAFDSQRFQYIQVRYRKLKYQTKWRLALRELYAYKKITIALLLIFGVLVTYVTCAFTNPNDASIVLSNAIQQQAFYYMEYHTDSEDEMNQLLSLDIENTYVYKKSLNIEDVYYDQFLCDFSLDVFMLEDPQLFKDRGLVGEVPRNDHEMIVCGHNVQFGYLMRDNGGYIHKLERNDCLNINGKDYWVIGTLYSSESIAVNDSMYDFYFMPENALYIPLKGNENLFKDVSYYLRFYYYTDKQKTNIQESLSQVIDIDNVYYCDRMMEEHHTALALFSMMNIEMLMIPILICFIFCYYMNKNQMDNHYKDYQMYRMIGMTKKDLLMKQFAKAIFVTIYVLLIQLFWIIMIDIYYQVVMLPIVYVLLTCLGALIISVVIYCLPLYGLMKKIISKKKIGEE